VSPPQVRRRDLVLGGTAVAGAALLLAWQADLQGVSVPERLLRRLGIPAGLRAPTVTGRADDALLRRLWWLCTRIAARWQLAEFVDLTEDSFAQFIDAKTREAPSYLTEYRAAGRILAEVERDMKVRDDALDRILARPAGFRDFGTTRIGRLQKFVVAEIMKWNPPYLAPVFTCVVLANIPMRPPIKVALGFCLVVGVSAFLGVILAYAFRGAPHILFGICALIIFKGLYSLARGTGVGPQPRFARLWTLRPLSTRRRQEPQARLR